MEYIEVNGKKPLYGIVEVQGSKNASLPVLAATLISGKRTIIHNCPRISDIFHMINILTDLKIQVDFTNDYLVIDSKNAKLNKVPDNEAMAMRSSITLAGAMLSRFKKAVLPYPGGCVIGKRPIDLHLYAFERLGAKILENKDNICVDARELIGSEINFPIKSVGATENAILAAVSARGITHIINGSVEPEIISLCEFLKLMGVNISYNEKGSITIEGTSRFNNVEYTIIPDRIVAGTYVLAAAATRGMIILKSFPYEHMKSVLDTFEKMGGKYRTFNNDIIVDGTHADKSIDWIETEVYPGFPTDLQSQLMAVLISARGDSCIRENIFESRFNTVWELKKFGAQVYVNSTDAFVTGTNSLVPAEVEAKDLRGGAALIIAALSVDGISRISGCSYIKRGYEDICNDLKKLGADIREIQSHTGG